MMKSVSHAPKQPRNTTDQYHVVNEDAAAAAPEEDDEDEDEDEEK